MDPSKKYEIFANGHPNFLTKACKNRVLEANVHMAENFNCFNESEPAGMMDGQGDSREVHIADEELRGAMVNRRRRRAVQEAGSRGARLIQTSTRLPEPVEEFGCRYGFELLKQVLFCSANIKCDFCWPQGQAGDTQAPRSARQ